MEGTSDDSSSAELTFDLSDPSFFQDGESIPSLESSPFLDNLMGPDITDFDCVSPLPLDGTDALLLPPVAVEDAIDGASYSLDTGEIVDCSIQDQESMDGSIDTMPAMTECHGDRRRRRSKHVWSKEEDERLLVIVNELGVITRKRFWPIVVKKMGCNLTVKQVREHYKRLVGEYKKSKWSEDEIDVIHRHLSGLITIEDVSGLLKRNPKQIKERIAIETKNKSEWSREELDYLEELVGVYYNNFSMIRQMMIGRGFNRTYQQIRCKVIALLKRQ